MERVNRLDVLSFFLDPCFVLFIYYKYLKANNFLSQGVSMFYRKASPLTSVKLSGQTILLLHGRSFKSETWQNLGTMHLMAGIGHLVVAVDLPGGCLICYFIFLDIITEEFCYNRSWSARAVS
jgi:hypothetical protein